MKINEIKNNEAIIEEKENSSNGARRTRSSRTAVFNERDRIPGNTVDIEMIATVNNNNKTQSPRMQTYSTTSPKKRKKSLANARSPDDVSLRSTRLRNHQISLNNSIEAVETTTIILNDSGASEVNSPSQRTTRKTPKQEGRKADLNNSKIAEEATTNLVIAIESNLSNQVNAELLVDSVVNKTPKAATKRRNKNKMNSSSSNNNNNSYGSISEVELAVAEGGDTTVVNSSEDLNEISMEQHRSVSVDLFAVSESPSPNPEITEYEKGQNSNVENGEVAIVAMLGEKPNAAFDLTTPTSEITYASGFKSQDPVVIANESDCNQNDILNNADIHDTEILLSSDHNLIGILDGDVVFDLNSNTEQPQQPTEDNTTNTQTEQSAEEIALQQPTTAFNDFNSTLTDPNSPSGASLDSAKGSSVTTDPASWGSFSTGDLYWGKIYNYCYWPCMVCPDPDGNIFNAAQHHFGRQPNEARNQLVVHVRFFADNGRRNWVKQENLIPFTGQDSYMEITEAVAKKYGTKSPKYKMYIPKPTKKVLWQEAIKEANIIAETHYPERLEKFYDIFETSKNFLKLERKRRQSMYVTTTTASAPSPFEADQSNASFKRDRERSLSPFSPAYSPVKSSTIKRRKLSNTATEHQQYNYPPQDLANTSQDVVELFQNSEFQQLYATMREYVMGPNEDQLIERSLVTAVRNIWALREINEQKMEKQMLSDGKSEEYDLGSSLVRSVSYKNGRGMIKRLSNRIKSINTRRSMPKLFDAQTAGETSASSLMSTSTVATTSTTTVAEKTTTTTAKKPLNRPITEVIDDIFSLDSKYLFRGLSRDLQVCKYCYKSSGHLVRCSKKCMTWLHVECLSNPQESKHKKVLRSSKHVNHNNNEETLDEHAKKVEEIQQEEETASVELEPEAIGQATIHVTAETEHVTEHVTCNECLNETPTLCCICQKSEGKAGDDELVYCQMTHCTKAFHPGCCKYWPQARVAKSTVRCPSHVCHTCVSDDPKGKFQNLSNAKLTKCVQCPASYHMDSTCIPAGSEILTASHIICPRHSNNKTDAHVNVNWCFICVKGGQVLCCETCPISVHAQCLNIQMDPNDAYICEECESGRLPLYGEMVWAKFNSFRWWPAIILPPPEVPVNIMRKAHNKLEFVVRFFGTHDHGWISRRRVYLYVEGDCSEPPRNKSSLDQSYLRGVEEAKEIYEIIKSKKVAQSMQTENKEKLHPQPYVKIKTNRAVPPVKLHIDMESVSKCECNPNDECPCGPDTNCLNRVLYHECNPKICPAGQNCQNQMFEKRKSPRLDVVYMKERGFGLITREPIKAGQFIIEYVGEIINDDEFKQRMQQKTLERDENFYFLSVEKDYIIDAGPKGNLARFMNHSCDPNCETQKWVVNSLNRIGLFAVKDIAEDTELTFNYHWDELLGSEKKTCFCGAAKCAGQIGGKYKEEIKITKQLPVSKKKDKKRKPVKRLQKKPNSSTSTTKNQPKINIALPSMQKKRKAVKKSSASDEQSSELDVAEDNGDTSELTEDQPAAAENS